MSTTTLDSLVDYADWRAAPGEFVSHAFVKGTRVGDPSFCGHSNRPGAVRSTDAYCAECVIALDEVFGHEITDEPIDVPVKATTVDACDRCQTADLSLDHTCVLRPVTVTEQDLRFLLDQHIELLGGPDEVLSTDDRTIDVLGNIRDALDGV